MNRFAECLPHILQFEGGYVNDPTDRGGATNKGITQRTYDRHQLSHNRKPQPVEYITDQEVGEIYQEDYWDACQCDALPIPLDLAVFDAAVQHGAKRSAKWVQLVTGMPTDGVIGPKTLYAINQKVVDGKGSELVSSFMRTRAVFYTGIIANDPSQQKFAKGWGNRMRLLQSALV